MDWITGIQNAINYVEDHLTETIDYEAVARESFSSGYHFQRVFSILSGYTLGEYIRNRRLSLAGTELATTKEKVIDIAAKYGYESPDAFAKAFQKFHGITPSQARGGGAVLKNFSRLSLKISLEGGSTMKYRIEEKGKLILTGYKERFTGVPYGEERSKQEENLFVTTRAKQWLLRGASDDYDTDYCVVANVDDDGYDFYIAATMRSYERENLYNPKVTGVDFMEDMHFETVTIPGQTYAVFETQHVLHPTQQYIDIRQKIVSEWLPGSGYCFTGGPELTILHWNPNGDPKQRYIEICIPIEKAE